MHAVRRTGHTAWIVHPEAQSMAPDESSDSGQQRISSSISRSLSWTIANSPWPMLNQTAFASTATASDHFARTSTHHRYRSSTHEEQYHHKVTMDPRRQFSMNAQASRPLVDGGSPEAQHLNAPTITDGSARYATLQDNC